MLQCYIVTMLQCYNVTMLQCYNVTMLQCYIVTLLQCYIVTMLQCYNVIILQCYNVINTMLHMNVLVLGIRRLAIPEKRYVYMIMMLWSDKSELIIYRTLEQIRQLLKRMELVAPTDAKHDLAESSQLINKKRLLGDMRLSVHVKHLAHLMKLFAVLEFHGSILHDSVCQNFFMKKYI